MKALVHLRRDKKMGALIDHVGGYKLRRRRNRYESLVGAIVNQQLAGVAAQSILGRFRALYPSRFPRPEDVVATRDSQLRRIGLSSMKTSYIKGLSRELVSGRLKLDSLSRMDDESVIDTLTTVRGIGRWTAQMYLMFTLGRPDVLPTGDLGLRAGVQKLYSLRELPTSDQLVRRAEKWRPYRTAATWYIWRGVNGFGDIG